MQAALFEKLAQIPYLQGFDFRPQYARESGELSSFELDPTDRTLRKAENLLRLIPADLTGKSLLDIGCHKGFFCFEALRRGAGRVVGIDVLDELIELLRQIADSAALFGVLEFRRAPFSKELEASGPFDVILFSSSYHCVYADWRSHERIFKSLARLKPERVVLELPLGTDDGFAHDVRKVCSPEEYAAYNVHTILCAASLSFGSDRYVANSGFLRMRDIFVLEGPGLSEAYDCEWAEKSAPWTEIARSEGA